MASTDLPIILFHYPFSPYAKRVLWYLSLRQIPYTECIQPFTLPRPDLAALGIAYRRIPLLSIGRDVYADTRIILSKLDELYPASSAHPAISAASGDGQALQGLLSRAWIDGGIFLSSAGLMPPDMPGLQDPKFAADRADYMGLPAGAPSPFSKEAIAARRPEALAEIRDAVELLETTLLADGREWLLKTQGPSLADIEAVWPFHWLSGMKGALPGDLIGPKQFPKVFAWIARFEKLTSAKAKELGKPKKVKGDEAAKIVTGSGYAEQEGVVDQGEAFVKAAGLQKGDNVRVWPTDSGSKHKDTGKLFAATSQQIVVEVQGDAGSVRLHTPRHGFRVSRTEKGNL